MTEVKLKYFAVLEAAIRRDNIPVGEPGHYEKVKRDDPLANEFRASTDHGWFRQSTPIGGNRAVAEYVVQALNSAFNTGKNSPPEDLLVGRMGHRNRNEETMP